jgi:rare lipoprotein A
LIATAILAGGTAIGLTRSAHHQSLQTITESTSSPERPVAERPGRSLERQQVSPTPTPSAKPRIAGSCAASFYSEPQGTASGETFDPEALTAAHKTLPFNTRVRVTNPNNGKSVTVRINDRGPYVDGRCLDLSRAAFRQIADLGTGVLKRVTYEVVSQ